MFINFPYTCWRWNVSHVCIKEETNLSLPWFFESLADATYQWTVQLRPFRCGNRSGQQEYHKISQQSIPRIHLRELFMDGWKPRSLSSQSPASRKAISMETVHTILRFIDIHATSYLEYIYWLLVAIMELIQQHLSTRPKSGCWSPSQSDADTELSPCLTFIAAQRQRSYA